MIQLVKKKTKQHLVESEQELQHKYKAFVEVEADLRKRLRQLEAQNNELSAMIAKDKVKLGDQALKATSIDNSADDLQARLNTLQRTFN